MNMSMVRVCILMFVGMHVRMHACMYANLFILQVYIYAKFTVTENELHPPGIIMFLVVILYCYNIHGAHV